MAIRALALIEADVKTLLGSTITYSPNSNNPNSVRADSAIAALASYESIYPAVDTATLTSELLAYSVSDLDIHDGAHSWCCYGDSMVFLGSEILTNITQTLALSPLAWACGLSEQRAIFDPRHNFGVGSETTTQILARIDDVLESGCDGCFFMGGVNDIQTTTFQKTRENLIQISQRIIDAGIKFSISPIMPRSFVDADYSLRRAQINNFILDDLRRIVPGVVVCDARTMCTDYSDNLSEPFGKTPVGDATAFTIDGVHMAQQMAYAIGIKLNDILRVLYPAPRNLSGDPSNTYDATKNPNGNRLLNGNLNSAAAGTAGAGVTTAASTVAGNWTLNRLGGDATIAASETTRSLDNGKTVNCQTLVLTAGTVESSFQFTQVTQAQPVGQESEFSARLEFVGGSRCTGFYLRCTDGATQVAADLASGPDADGAYWTSDPWSVISRCNLVSGNAATQHQAQVIIKIAPGSSDVTVRISELCYKTVTPM